MQIAAIKGVSAKNKRANNNLQQKTINITTFGRHGDKSAPNGEQCLIAYEFLKPYKPAGHLWADNYSIPVHNSAINDYMKSEYTSDSFKRLFNFAKNNGVFQYLTDGSTGLIKTSFIEPIENELMCNNIWITDTCHNMELVKANNPQDCTKFFNLVTRFYTAQQSAFDEIIANPLSYNRNNKRWAGQAQTGVGHAFKSNGEPHEWFPKTRLESLGNYLSTSMDLISTGLNGGNYGYKSSSEIPQEVINAIANTTKYLEAIHYPTARSCGNWEEATFTSSLTSDTAIINEGMRKLIKFMYEPTNNEEVKKVRERLVNNTKHGFVFTNEECLKDLLKTGELVVEMRTDKGECMDSADRTYDAALSFVPQTEKFVTDKNRGDVIMKDCREKLKFLNALSRSIVRNNGAIRYHGDIYLHLDYHVVDWRNPKDYPNREAEWFMVSEIADGYGAVVSTLLNEAENDKRNGGRVREEVKNLLSEALSKETEYINRSYARITPKGMYKANCRPCPEFKVPEAYEAVTTEGTTVKYVPGSHPLTWAAASLYKASANFMSNLQRYEILKVS